MVAVWFMAAAGYLQHDGLGEMPRTVGIDPAVERKVASQQLQRHGFEDGETVFIAGRDRDCTDANVFASVSPSLTIAITSPPLARRSRIISSVFV